MLRVLFALAVCLGLAGCRHAPPAGPPPDPVELLERVRAAHRVPQTLTCDGKAFVDAPRNGGRYALRIAVRRPASLRIEALTPIGDPAAILVADGGRFALLDLRNNVFYRGPASPQNLARLLPAPFTPEELVALLTGAPPELPGSVPIEATRESESYHLVLATAHGIDSLGLGLDLRLAEVRRTTREGHPVWTVGLDEHDDSSGAQVPRLLHLSVPDERVEMDLRLRNLVADRPPPSGAFLLGVPKGMRVEEVP